MTLSATDTTTFAHPSTGSKGRAASALLSLVILELTAATGWIHLSLGGSLFQLNALGFIVLGVAYGIAAFVPNDLVRRLAWLPRVALAGYALLTIAAYLVMGPWFVWGWVTKGIELAIVGLLVVELLRVQGSVPRAGRS